MNFLRRFAFQNFNFLSTKQRTPTCGYFAVMRSVFCRVITFQNVMCIFLVVIYLLFLTIRHKFRKYLCPLFLVKLTDNLTLFVKYKGIFKAKLF